MPMTSWPPNTFGIAGLKNTGKTTLVERLVTELSSRGLRVATLKHAHHDFGIDHAGTDSYRHRAAGSVETIVSSPKQTVQMTSVGQKEPTLSQLLARLGAHDIALVEGWKSESLPKLMLVKEGEERPYDGTIAVVRPEGEQNGQMPSFQRDDIAAIADFLTTRLTGSVT